MKFKIKDLVLWFGKKAIIAGTKDQPADHSLNSPLPIGTFLLNQGVIPFENKDMDYQIMFENASGDYSGLPNGKLQECKESDLELSL